MWKGIVDDPSHPSYAKIRALGNDADSSSPDPVRRSGPKIHLTDPCPCGSGRKIQEVLSRVNAAAMPKTTGHKWQFKARFRRHAFGWKSQPAIVRVREAVSEIKQVAKTDPVHAAEGVVALLERLSPALENIDSSSGAIGTAVNRAIAELVPIVVAAPASVSIRAAWLERRCLRMERSPDRSDPHGTQSGQEPAWLLPWHDR